MSLAVIGLILVATGTVYAGARLSAGGSVLELDPEELKQSEVTSVAALTIPVFSSVCLISLFYYFAYLQYLMIAMIVFVGAISAFQLMKLFIQQAGPNNHTAATVVSGILTLLGVVYWLMSGNLIIHNILGCALSITFISTIRFPSFKIACLLMAMLVAYDIFWVFYSEFFFDKNVMVDVATKVATNPMHDVGQRYDIPLLQQFKPTVELPIKLMFWSSEYGRHVMLGLGDIALPGAVVAFALRCDEEFANYWSGVRSFSSSSRDLEKGESSALLGGGGSGNQQSQVQLEQVPLPLFNHSMFGYFVGMLAAFVCNLYFQHAQPALIYLVPGVMIPMAVKAWQLGRFNAIWSGVIQRDASE